MNPSPPCAFRCASPAVDMNGPKTRSRSTTRLEVSQNCSKSGVESLSDDDRVDLGEPQDEVGLHVDGRAVHPVVDHQRRVGRGGESL